MSCSDTREDNKQINKQLQEQEALSWFIIGVDMVGINKKSALMGA